MSIIVNSGELALIEAFQKRKINIIIEPLLVGDIHIRNETDTIYIFERKAKGDLDASIKDGRYHEQKGRLLKTGLEPKKIIYIIEQLSKPIKGSVEYKRIWSAICNSQHRDGLTVFKTDNIDETVDYLFGMANAVIKQPVAKQSEKVDVKIKKNKVTPDTWFKYSLSLIPKISLNVAEIIVNRYPTMKELITAIKSEGPECISELKCGKRRIGAISSKQICDAFNVNF